MLNLRNKKFAGKAIVLLTIATLTITTDSFAKAELDILNIDNVSISIYREYYPEEPILLSNT